MALRRYRHEWSDLAFIDSDFIAGWGAFRGYDGPLEFDGCTPSKAHAVHDTDRDTFTVIYGLKGEGSAAAPVHCAIGLERQPCTYDKPGSSGGRVYFRAPCCRRCVRKLALLPEGVRCARCGSITNTSKRKSGVQRLIHKADLIAGQLDCPNWFTPPKARPKGMRRETFNRLAEEHARLVQQAMAIVRPRLARAARRGVAAQMGALMRAGM
jgi:hypothetical protein